MTDGWLYTPTCVTIRRMKADIKKELIETEKDLALEALREAERVLDKRHREASERVNVEYSRAPLGVDLYLIQLELYNPDNSIDLTDLSNNILRDRLSRLESELKVFSEKLGRERVYMTPEAKDALEDWKRGREQMLQDRADRVTQLSADLGYEVEWIEKAPYRNRRSTVVILIEDLEAIAQKI